MNDATFSRLTKLLVTAAVVLGPIAAAAQDSRTPTNPMGQLGGSESFHAKLFPNQPYNGSSAASNPSAPSSGAEVFGAKINGEKAVVDSAGDAQATK